MSQDRPNILYIMDDQHRWDYLGSMGADFVKTPNLDRLSERGIRICTKKQDHKGALCLS